jgi:hypothetical protein
VNTTAPADRGVAVDSAPDDLDAAYAEIRREPYLFTWAARQWQLPHLGGLDYRLQLEIEQTDSWDVDAVQALLARLFGAEQAQAWATVEVPTPVLFMVFERWLAHSGEKMGEDEASTGSSESTGPSSRPTSAASTGSASPKPSSAKREPRKAGSRRVNSST